jgi:hypothetical protein
MTFLKRRSWPRRRTPLRRKPFVRKFPASPKMPANPDDIKRLSLKELDDIAWTYFSIYIRKRDRISGDYAKCITCPKILHWRAMDAGHFVTRRCRPIKFHELNNHAQSPDCNREGGGMPKVHEAKLRELYGDAIVDEFLRYKKVCPVEIFTRTELIELLHKYKPLSEES